MHSHHIFVRTSAVAAAGLFLLGVSACDGTTTGGASDSESSASVTGPVVVPETVGRDGATVKTVLEEAGLKVEWDGGDKGVFAPENWVATGSTPAAGETVDAGSTVTVQVIKPGASSAAATAEAATTGGLTQTYAMAACDTQGNQYAQWGYNPSWVTNTQRSSYDQASDSWMFIYGAKITNAYGSVRDTTISCSVTGSNTAPQVMSFSEQ